MANSEIIDLGGFEYYKSSDEDENLNDEILLSVQNKEIALNMLLNANRGVPVIYYRTLPDVQTADPFLNEYSIKGVVEFKNIKIVIPDGIIPDEKSEYDIWGLTSDAFDAHISMAYWESVFGSGTSPRNEDVIVIPKIKRAYRISSNYPATGSVKEPLYYSVHLSTYDDNSALLKSEDVEKKLNDMLIDKNEIFGEQMKYEMENTVDTQSRLSTVNEDLYRSYIDYQLQMITSPVFFGKQKVFDNFYNMPGIVAGSNAVSYINKFAMDKSFAISGWINLLGGQTELFSSKSVKIGYDGISNITLITNLGRQINIIPVGALPVNTWLGYCFNFNNEFNSTTVYIWALDSPNNVTRYDTTLRNVLKKQIRISPHPFEDDIMTLIAGNYKISNIRVWKTAVPDEYMQIAMLSEKVARAGSAYIIDNVDLRSKMAKIATGKIL